MDLKTFSTFTAEAVAAEAKAIRVGASTHFDNGGDCVARQSAFLQSIASQHPAEARQIATQFRGDPARFAEVADVPPSVVGLYARVMEDRLAVVPVKVNRRFEIKARKTYKTQDNAIRAVEKAGFEDIRHFMMIDPETHRWFPVFVGQEAAQRGVHFHFHVVG